MQIAGLFGLLILGTILFVIQTKLSKNPLDLPMIAGSIFCWAAAGYGFFKLAFGG